MAPMRPPVWLPLLVILAGCGPVDSDRAATAKADRTNATPAERVYFPEARPETLDLYQSRKIQVHSLLNIRAPMKYGDFIWNEKGIPQGHVFILVNLGKQLISVFRDGHEIGTSVIIYGADGKPTPKGDFPIISKIRDRRSSLYQAEMPYTLRITEDGVSIHGSNVRERSATHGCIGVPLEFAKRLFPEVVIGQHVVII